MTEPLRDTDCGGEHSERAKIIVFQALDFFTKLVAVPFILTLRQPAELMPQESELWNYSHPEQPEPRDGYYVASCPPGQAGRSETSALL